MSGKKTGFISFSLEQYQELHENFFKHLYFGHQEKENQNSQTDVSFMNAIQNNQNQTENREQSFMNLASQFNQQLQEVESHTSSAVRQSQNDLVATLSSQAQSSEKKIMDLVSNHIQVFNDQVLADHHQQQNQLTRLRRQMVTLKQSESARADMAEEWIYNTRSLIQFIDANYQHQRFMPSKLESLNDDLQLSIQNFEIGLYEASLVGAQNIYRRTSELRILLERDESQWNTCYSLACRNIKILADLVLDKKEIPYKPDGQNETYQINIDYWSNGKWSELWRKITQIQNQLRVNPEQLSIQELRTWVSETFTLLENELEKTVENAVNNLITSQIRTNIAELVMMALQKQGYELNQYQYQQDDSRQGFSFDAENITGNAVRVVINPGFAEKCELQLEAIDKQPQTEHFLRRRALEIATSLEKFGLTMDGFIQKAASGYETSIQPGFSMAETKGQYAVH